MRALPAIAFAFALGASKLVAAQEAEGQEPLPLNDLAKLSSSERRQLLSALSRDDQAKALAQFPVGDLLSTGLKRVGELGTYRLRLIKEERVDGKLLPQQTMDLLVQQAPLAILAEVVAGPAKGRRLLYNAALRTDEFRVKEAGLLGAAGAVWIGLDNKMTRRDTRHRATNLGYSPVLSMIETYFVKAQPVGGYARKDEGFGENGYCMLYTAPAAAKGLYATKARLCVDPVELLPTRVETWDGEGLLERLTFELKATRVKTPEDQFTPKGAGL